MPCQIIVVPESRKALPRFGERTRESHETVTLVWSHTTMTVQIYGEEYDGLKVYEHSVNGVVVMRRLADDYVNARQILSAAGVTRRPSKLSGDSIPGCHPQCRGIWIPLAQARELAQKHGVQRPLAPLFDLVPPPTFSLFVPVDVDVGPVLPAKTPSPLPAKDATAAPSMDVDDELPSSTLSAADSSLPLSSPPAPASAVLENEPLYQLYFNDLEVIACAETAAILAPEPNTNPKSTTEHLTLVRSTAQFAADTAILYADSFRNRVQAELTVVRRILAALATASGGSVNFRASAVSFATLHKDNVPQQDEWDLVWAIFTARRDLASLARTSPDAAPIALTKFTTTEIADRAYDVAIADGVGPTACSKAARHATTAVFTDTSIQLRPVMRELVIFRRFAAALSSCVPVEEFIRALDLFVTMHASDPRCGPDWDAVWVRVMRGLDLLEMAGGPL
ncbi:Transcriptional factor [Mycena chlorophos]|uniref:Transcriptional factor n=1 Tax=Mycena chlorophos TaxID=658473 RepID=A0A8H6VR79_MYCCL|nr:Transcriptional factor [Mycena chlorophos]